MCGIWALFGVSTDSVEHMDTSFAKIKHRGPDAWKIQYDNKVKVIFYIEFGLLYTEQYF